MRRRFKFSKAEKAGVAALSLIIVFLLVLINMPTHSVVPNVFLSDTTAVEYIYPEKKRFSQKAQVAKKRESEQTLYSPFNPNNYQKTDWQSIGFSSKQAQVILNYKQQISGFKNAEDVKDCFVINEDKFNALKPYLRFPKLTETAPEEIEIKQVVKLIDLNEANHIELESISGIGPFYSEKIIELRQELGGFYHINQIKDIYGMTPENFDRIKDQVVIKPGQIQKIDLKNAEFKDLKKHPYINWKQAQILTALIDKTINPQFWEKIESNEAFNPADIEKLKPYLK